MHWRGKIQTLILKSFIKIQLFRIDYIHLKYGVFRWLIKVTLFYNLKKFQKPLDCL